MGVNNRIDVRIGEENKPPEVQKSALDTYQTCTNIENVYLSSSSSDTYWGLSATCDSLSRIEIQATCAQCQQEHQNFCCDQLVQCRKLACCSFWFLVREHP